MGKEYNRIRRLYVGGKTPGETGLQLQQLSDGREAPADMPSLLEQDHRDARVLHLEADDFSRLFPEASAEPGTWYLVDPAGWLMMSYNPQVNFKDVMTDLKFLLKNS